jgi:hypothetical protein
VESLKQKVQLRELELAGCYVIVADAAKDQCSPQQGHDSYMALQKVDRDFRTMKTGLREVPPAVVEPQPRTGAPAGRCLRHSRPQSRRGGRT